MTELISPHTLEELVTANAVRAATVVGDEGGYKVAVKYGMASRILAARTPAGQLKERLFSTLDAVSKYLRKIGLLQYEVDDSHYIPPKRGTKRPDRSEALKRAHGAAEYDKWLREQVQASLDDPRPSIPHAEAMALVEERIKEIRAKARDKG